MDTTNSTMPDTPLSFAWEKIDPANVSERRLYLKAFYVLVWQVSEEDLASYTEKNVVKACGRIFHKGHARVGTRFFDWFADMTLWIFAHHVGNAKMPPFPWPEFTLGSQDVDDPDSPVYARFVASENGKIAAQTTQSAPAAAQMTDPLIIDLEKRQAAWSLFFGEVNHRLPTCGPFEVLLPRWLNFETKVWGPEGQQLERINEHLIVSGLAVSWAFDKEDDAKPEKLIVGFSEGNRLCNWAMLQSVWSAVFLWAKDLYEGKVRTLADHLEMNLLLRMDMDMQMYLSAVEPAELAFNKAQENMLAVKERSDRHDAAVTTLRDEVIELGKNGYAFVSLMAWIFKEQIDREGALARIQVAEQIWTSVCHRDDMATVLKATGDARKALGYE
ncbi:hypothetical protein BGZ61DRAFT_538053 [Ilyonectria robusta]|uniref:uncharacterized protein n=1 Tax=Ilyonectria robusta TaxID=1079257 RepID=UPI001E8CE135|nr:uncharacterized protein BGZ61DRAFT_538053 [Ilyonectria robusta]KAH8667883.1 hypothetical protein BGZ61DRAFT_538053 [Ilyonectria robusta]